jgi:hypothetical protein
VNKNYQTKGTRAATGRGTAKKASSRARASSNEEESNLPGAAGSAM